VSLAVDLAELPAHISRFGSSAFLVTSSAEGPPHVSSVLVTVAGDNLEVPVGRKTRANVAERPAVTLVWWGDPDGDYCLIVDAAAGVGTKENLLVRPTSAVLHRLAKA
jgi:hypothetical protein